jgi:hypothetical protein
MVPADVVAAEFDAIALFSMVAAKALCAIANYCIFHTP